MGRWWGRRRRSTWYEKTTRRTARDGIKAKSQKGAIGESWWSQRFIEVLESFEMGARLSRGRSYARSGQVCALAVAPGVAKAEVQGSRAAPYRVRIELPPFGERAWKRVERALAARAIFLAELLAGRMPTTIEEAFTACGLSLFPAGPLDLETSCTCPDWANPCKHIAATYYILAERFDEDPFQIFAWRGRSREALLEHLRAQRRSPASADASAPASPARLAAIAADAPVPPPLPVEPDAFWRAGPRLAELRLAPRAAEVPDAILRELGPLDDEPDEPGSLDALLRPLYARMAEGAARRAGGEGPGELAPPRS